MMNVTGGSVLRQQLERPLNQKQRSGQKFYRSDGSKSGEPGPSGFVMPLPPQPLLKDEAYWNKRQKNNEAARRSREKKRMYEVELLRKMIDLNNENFVLKAQLIAIEQQFGVRGDDVINAQQVTAQRNARLPINHEDHFGLRVINTYITHPIYLF